MESPLSPPSGAGTAASGDGGSSNTAAPSCAVASRPSFATRPPSPGLLVGRRGARYRLGHSPIGAGAQAEVWPAEREDGRALAVKLARPGRAAADALEAEHRWLTTLGELGVACALPCFDHVDWDGRPGLVLPRLARNVDDLVRARADADRARALEAVLAVGVQLVSALAALHQAELGDGRLVHRDVKPENVLVDAFGALYLADLAGGVLEGAPRDVGVFGSPLWAPPDQMLPGVAEVSPTWDTYAACVLVFHWVAGDLPSFQRDPTPRLTPVGAAIHGRLARLGDAPRPRRAAAATALLKARAGVHAVDVVAPAALVGLPAEDRARIARGVAALCEPALYGDEALELATDRLVAVLGRGLSPHAAPSPPNRYAEAAELEDALASVARGLATARRRRALADPAPGAPMARAPRARHDHPVPGARAITPRCPAPPAGRATPWAGFLATALIVGVLGGAAATRLAERAEADAPPPSRVHVGAARGQGAPFRIGRTEVSNAAWRACVEAGGCRAALGVPAVADGPTQPVVGVRFQDAAEWCAWDGGRLPTEAEWERAAFGDLNGALRRWPWGEFSLDCTRANVGACGLGLAAAVDAFADGASAWGALQMVGNAWEWTATRGPGGARVLRGGAYDTSATELEAGARRREHPERALPTYSFRCVYPD